MTNPIVVVQVNIQQAPTPSTLQKTGALISQGGTNLAVGTYKLLTIKADLTPVLPTALALSALTSSGTTATATAATTTASSGAYASPTVTLNLDDDVALVVGSVITVSNAAGTGSFASINGTHTLIAGTNGTTAVFTIGTGLTMTIASADVAVNLTLANGQKFITTIAGASPADYNGTVTGTVTSATTFTYVLASSLSSPATGSATYTPQGQGELQAMVNTYFGQGRNQPVYVLELGTGSVATAVATLDAFITASPQFFYAYLVPRSWDADSDFTDLAAEFEAPNAKTYFYVTTTAATYTTYTDLQKCIEWTLEAPVLPLTEFTNASLFYRLLNYKPSSTNRVAPFEYGFVFGVTPYPQTGNASLLTSVKAAGGSYIAQGSEGGISNLIIIGGNYADGNPINYWYSIDWVQINIDLNVSNAIINGSNNPVNPLYYNQDGINRLQGVAANTMGSGITFGLVLDPVTQAQLNTADLTTALDQGIYDNQTLVNAVPFVDYTAANPGDYKIGQYNGFSILYEPLRGFDQVLFNVTVANFGQ